MNNNQIIKIYTDGACSGNPGPGGWAFVIDPYIENNNTKHISQKNDYQAYSGFQDHTTNNQMELMAVIQALEYILNNNHAKYIIYTDSKYVHDGLLSWLPNWKKNNWKNSAKQSVKNKELWEKLDNLYSTANHMSHNVQIEWIKGHSINLGNQLADSIAVCASKQHAMCNCKNHIFIR